ncbi:MAG: signal peptidase I [Oscillospiraceae bacterium]|jgi:signal peptidase I|nr:signal peptidase I [Oscillospiraceae bacterium]
MNSSEQKLNFAIKGSRFYQIFFEWQELVAQSLIVVIFVLAFFFRIFTVNGSSMRDTLYNGDKVVIRRWDYTPKNGDIVVIKTLPSPLITFPIIKRIIATEGQSLSINVEENSVIVDGIKLDESYIKEPMRVIGDAELPNVVPKGNFVAFGDNRNGSTDSRFKEVGLIPKDYIIGKAEFIYFPFYRIKSLSLK